MSLGNIDLFLQELNLKEAGMAVYSPLALLCATCWYWDLYVLSFEPSRRERSIKTEKIEQMFSLKNGNNTIMGKN